MALFKRNKTWWTDFSVDGQRYRQSLHTTDWREAQGRNKELIVQASAGKLAPSSQQFARLAFGEAANRYLSDRQTHLAERSIQTERERLRPLRRFLGTTPLTRISENTIREYIAHRKSTGVGNRTVNLELGILRRILKRAKRWHLVAEDVKPLPERHEMGQALIHEEKIRLLKKAKLNPRWQNARWAMILALNTTMRSCEIRGLRWRHVDFMARTAAVRRRTTKTDAGERVIPLNADAWAATLELWERAKTLGGTEPDHYVFPACENFRFDPTRPQKSWRSAWRSLRKAAGLQAFRFHDTRHQAVTELAESPASDQTIMAIAGHVSPKMLAHYSHVRLEAKRRALDARSSRPLDPPADGGLEGGYGTNHVTKTPSQPVAESQVTERMARPAGLEPATPCLEGRCSVHLSYGRLLPF